MSKKDSLKDIYFEPQYCKINELLIKGKSETFFYEDENGEIIYSFIVREIPIQINGIVYNDISSPYGYGGPLIVTLKKDKEKLIENFMKEFDSYCLKNKIVSEFIRFHPIERNDEDFKNYYDIEFNRKTLGINLKKFDDPFTDEFSKSARKIVNRLLRKGITYQIIHGPKTNEINEFYKVYTNTMDRNKATDFYYFPFEYFENLNKNFNHNILIINIIYNENVIASGFYFIYAKYIHAHLSGTMKDYLILSPAYLIKYAATIWGKERGFEIIHSGGGVTEKEDDPLYIFKKRFSQKTEFDFCLGKRVVNQKIYDEMVKINKNKNNEFFPLYRD